MIKIPEKVKVAVQGKTISVEGPKGKLARTFNILDLELEVKDSVVYVACPSLMMGNTVESHIKNMMAGVTEGYAKKMQLIYSHFPITVEVKGSVVNIKNFQGEKKPRRAKIVGTTKVEVKGQEVFITGIDKEAVGQTIANLSTATKIKNRDSRVFQDGLYTVEE
jgi:large subunit ribosomal protein L6